VKGHGINPDPECPLFSEVVPEFSAIEHLELPSARTVLRIVADAFASFGLADLFAMVVRRNPRRVRRDTYRQPTATKSTTGAGRS